MLLPPQPLRVSELQCAVHTHYHHPHPLPRPLLQALQQLLPEAPAEELCAILSAPRAIAAERPMQLSSSFAAMAGLLAYEPSQLLQRLRLPQRRGWVVASREAWGWSRGYASVAARGGPQGAAGGHLRCASACVVGRQQEAVDFPQPSDWPGCAEACFAPKACCTHAHISVCSAAVVPRPCGGHRGAACGCRGVVPINAVLEGEEELRKRAADLRNVLGLDPQGCAGACVLNMARGRACRRACVLRGRERLRCPLPSAVGRPDPLPRHGVSHAP
jgi:hypothetical protein